MKLSPSDFDALLEVRELVQDVAASCASDNLHGYLSVLSAGLAADFAPATSGPQGWTIWDALEANPSLVRGSDSGWQ